MNPIRRQFFYWSYHSKAWHHPKKTQLLLGKYWKTTKPCFQGSKIPCTCLVGQPPWHGMALRPFNCQLRSYHAKSICAAVQVWLQQVLMPWGRTKFKLGLAQIHNFISQEHLSGRQETGSWENRYERERDLHQLQTVSQAVQHCPHHVLEAFFSNHAPASWSSTEFPHCDVQLGHGMAVLGLIVKNDFCHIKALCVLVSLSSAPELYWGKLLFWSQHVSANPSSLRN